MVTTCHIYLYIPLKFHWQMISFSLYILFTFSVKMKQVLRKYLTLRQNTKIEYLVARFDSHNKISSTTLSIWDHRFSTKSTNNRLQNKLLTITAHSRLRKYFTAHDSQLSILHTCFRWIHVQKLVNTIRSGKNSI